MALKEKKKLSIKKCGISVSFFEGNEFWMETVIYFLCMNFFDEVASFVR